SNCPCVVSSGVIGLTTALCIQRHLKRSQTVLVVAREFPNSTSINYTSPWAGAHYRPIAGLSVQLIREAKQARRTYNVFRQIAADEPAAGVKFMEGIEYFESPSPELLEAFGRSGSAYAHLDGL